MTKTLLAALTVACSIGVAGAAHADDETGVFIFGGVDASANSVFGYAGAGFRIGDDIDSTGFVERVQVGYGQYSFDRGALPDGDGTVTTVDAMVGWQTVRETSRITVYAGLAFQDHDTNNDPTNPVQGQDWGAKVQAEYYGQPNPNMMVLAIGSYATPNETYFALGRVGWRIGGNTFVGPEVAIDGDARYDQWRAGVHATGFQIGPVGLGGSLGYSGATPGDGGVYGSVGVTLRY